MVETGTVGTPGQPAQATRKTRATHLSLGSVFVVAGFILSPLSWWNDLFVNVPIAYFMSYPFSLISKSLFLPAFIVGYWITNIVGLVIMHKGVVRVKNGLSRECKEDFCDPTKPFLVRYRKDILISILYTVVIVLLAALGVLEDPQTMFERFQEIMARG